jgi:hypothetical protein
MAGCAGSQRSPLLPLVAYVLPVTSMAAGPTPQGQRPTAITHCPTVAFLGMRGDNDGGPSPGITWDGSGIGADVHQLDMTVEKILGAGIAAKEQGVPFGVDPGSGVDEDDYLSYTIDDNGNPAGWVGDEVNRFVETVREGCPRTFIAVVAQSLSAMVLHYADQVPRYANAIVMFGDPLHVANNTTIDAGEDNSGTGFATGADTPFGLFDVPADMRPPGYPHDALDKAINASSYCLKDDGVCGSCVDIGCGSSLTNWWTAWQGNHTQYRTDLHGIMTKAAGLLAAVIAAWLIGGSHHFPSFPLARPPTRSPPTHPVPPMSGLFLYNASTGASYTEFPDGSGGWHGVKGPVFSSGWQVYQGQFIWNGRTDLFVYNPRTGTSYTDLSDGTGRWDGIKGPPFSIGWRIYTGDFGGDGRTDLFVYKPSTGTNYTEFPNNGGGWSGIKGPYFSPDWEVHPGNFSGGHKTDLFVYNPSTGANYLEVPSGSGGWSGIKGPYFSPGWSVYTGDFNGDGRTDLFVYNRGSGANYVELANGSGGWTSVKGPYFSPGWQVYPGIFR